MSTGQTLPSDSLEKQPSNDPQLGVTTTAIDEYFVRRIRSLSKWFHNVDGAPYRIGDNVKVLNNPSNDETFDLRFVGREGIVEHFDYDCGCGQTFPNDPMIGVKFSDGMIEEFWSEEITRLELPIASPSLKL